MLSPSAIPHCRWVNCWRVKSSTYKEMTNTWILILELQGKCIMKDKSRQCSQGSNETKGGGVSSRTASFLTQFVQPLFFIGFLNVYSVNMLLHYEEQLHSLAQNESITQIKKCGLKWLPHPIQWKMLPQWMCHHSSDPNVSPLVEPSWLSAHITDAKIMFWHDSLNKQKIYQQLFDNR